VLARETNLIKRETNRKARIPEEKKIEGKVAQAVWAYGLDKFARA